MERANIALTSIIKCKSKYNQLIKTILTEVPVSVSEQLESIKGLEKKCLEKIKLINSELKENKRAPRLSKAIDSLK